MTTESERKRILQDWISENPYSKARLQIGGRTETGTLLQPNGNYEGTLARIRNPGRRGGQQYTPIFDTYLTQSYPRLELQMENGRYKPVREVLDF